nr:MAG TPA: hypothetical protein [Caudoviricetes sp.]
MKMQFVTLKIDGNNFSISRKTTDTKNRCNSNYASCNITVLKPMFCCKSGFIASGFSGFESPIIEHDLNNVNESIDDFVKAVFKA